MKIAVFGLGYVGVVNLACLSHLGHEMWGCDIKSQKVDSVKTGKSPIFEPQVEEMLNEALNKGLLHASTDALEVIRHTDMALICVGTPSRADGTVNLDFALNTVSEIALCLKSIDKPYDIVFRSTIPPGTVENAIIPVFERELGSAFSNVTVSFLPEFLREGSAVKDFFQCSRIVIGCNSGEPAALKEVFGYSSDIPLVFTNLRTAEFVKYVDNAFHAAKIAFVNEAYAVGSAYDVDIEMANKIFLMDKHLNVAETYLRPGLPFGGSCLPKDMRAITHLANQAGIDVPVLKSILNSNQQGLRNLVSRVVGAGTGKIAIYGLTFKSGTDDVRESPMVYLLRSLAELGKDVCVHDTDINLTTLRIEHADLVKYVRTSPADALSDADVIVVCKKGFDHLTQFIARNAVVLNLFNQQRFDISNHQEFLY